VWLSWVVEIPRFQKEKFVMPAKAGMKVDFRREFKNRLDSGMRRNVGNKSRLPLNHFKTSCVRAEGSFVQIIGLTFAAVVFLLAGRAQGEELNIYFKTTPSIQHLRPYADPATMSVLVTGTDGRPVAQGTALIRLDAPRRGRLFSTDFPWVEGTRLHEMRVNLRQGRANWKYLFPIRGEYRLAVDVQTADGKKGSKEFAFSIRENEKKWMALAGFSAALFCLGLIAGRLFTRIPSGAMMLVAAGLSIAPGFLIAGEATQDGDAAVLEVEAATVGRPAVVRWHLNGTSAGADLPALLSFNITHLEKGKLALEIDRIPVAGEFAMKFQFTDGAEYRVVAVAEQPGKPSLRSERIISALALEPPIKAMIPALVYFIGLIALGVGAGRWSKRQMVATVKRASIEE
jgi:hypothetical protein